VAELECGHNRHVRHDPPWECRPWVVTTEGRRSRLGMRLNCINCDRAELPDRPEDAQREDGKSRGEDHRAKHQRIRGR
jgi:hypothetical protein